MKRYVREIPVEVKYKIITTARKASESESEGYEPEMKHRLVAIRADVHDNKGELIHRVDSIVLEDMDSIDKELQRVAGEAARWVSSTKNPVYR